MDTKNCGAQYVQHDAAADLCLDQLTMSFKDTNIVGFLPPHFFFLLPMTSNINICPFNFCSLRNPIVINQFEIPVLLLKAIRR